MKKKLISILLGVMLFVPGIVNAATYEYLVIRMGMMKYSHKSHTKELNKQAQDGWRLVQVIVFNNVMTFLYFEREVTE